MCTLSELTARTTPHSIGFQPIHSIYKVQFFVEYQYQQFGFKLYDTYTNTICKDTFFKIKTILSFLLQIILYLPVTNYHYLEKKIGLVCRKFLLSNEKQLGSYQNPLILYFNFLSVFLVSNWTVYILLFVLCYCCSVSVCVCMQCC